MTALSRSGPRSLANTAFFHVACELLLARAMRALLLMVVLCAACDDGGGQPCICPIDFAVSHDLEPGGDLGPRSCGAMTCGPGEACVLCSPGICGNDAGGTCDYYACVALPTACRSDRTCGCFAANGGSDTECQLACGVPFACVGGNDPRWDFICGGQ